MFTRPHVHKPCVRSSVRAVHDASHVPLDILYWATHFADEFLDRQNRFRVITGRLFINPMFTTPMFTSPMFTSTCVFGNDSKKNSKKDSKKDCPKLLPDIYHGNMKKRSL